MVADKSPKTCPCVRVASLFRKLWHDPGETRRVCLWSGLDDELDPSQEATRVKEALIGLVHCPFARLELTDQVSIIGAGDSARCVQSVKERVFMGLSLVDRARVGCVVWGV